METLKSITVNNFSLFFQALGYVLIALWMRAKLRYGLTNKIYKILFGENKFHNNEINRLWEEQQDIERFNALFDMQASHVSNITNLYKWLDEFNLDIKKFSGLGEWFDISRIKIGKPKKMQHALCYILFFSMFYVALIAFEVSVKSAALVQFHNSSTWMWLDKTSAKEYSYNIFRNTDHDWTIQKSACTSPDFNLINEGKNTGLATELISEICQAFSDKSISDKLDRIIKSQTYILVPCLIFLYLSLMFFLSEKKLVKVEKARQYIHMKYKDFRKKKSNALMHKCNIQR